MYIRIFLLQEKIKHCESESQSSLPTNDALSQVLGQDKPGRLRAMGRGITLTKFILSQANDKKLTDCQNTILELKQTIRMLVNNLVNISNLFII